MLRDRWGAKGHFFGWELNKQYKTKGQHIVLFTKVRYLAPYRAQCLACKTLSINLIADTKKCPLTPHRPLTPHSTVHIHLVFQKCCQI